MGNILFVPYMNKQYIRFLLQAWHRFNYPTMQVTPYFEYQTCVTLELMSSVLMAVLISSGVDG
jgi:hypothetical protein